MRKGWLIIVCMFFLVSFVFAADLPNYQDKYVNDFGGVLTISQVSDLRGLLSLVDQETTAEVVFVSVEQCAPYVPGDYAFQLATNWKVGKADKDNGLLVLYCKAENKIWATVGYGLEGILPDSKVGRMLDENYVPARDAGNVSEGIVLFMKSVSDVLYQNKEEIKSGQTSGSSSSDIDWITWIIIVLFVYSIIGRILGAIFKGKKRSSLPWFIPIFLPSGGSSSGGGFSGGGGFGGGGFGGGGAGR